MACQDPLCEYMNVELRTSKHSAISLIRAWFGNMIHLLEMLAARKINKDRRSVNFAAVCAQRRTANLLN